MDRGRVLIIDDEPLIGTTLKVLLGEEHDIVVATNGKEAEQLLAEDSDFDVILCDLMMPGISGMDLHAWLTQRSAAAARRMVFMTGGAFTDRARKWIAEVPNARLEKPFDPPELQRLIREWIAEARRRRPSDAAERTVPAGR